MVTLDKIKSVFSKIMSLVQGLTIIALFISWKLYSDAVTVRKYSQTI